MAEHDEQTQESKVQIVIDTLLDVLGVPCEDTFREQAVVFCIALEKNARREKVYKGLWREDGVADMAELAGHKAKRMRAHEHNMAGPFSDGDGGPGESEEAHEQQIYDNAMDDAVDMVNYAAFTARLVDAASLAQRGKPAR